MFEYMLESKNIHLYIILHSTAFCQCVRWNVFSFGVGDSGGHYDYYGIFHMHRAPHIV